MRCVIVGAGGFIGQHLGNHLVERGDDPTGLDVAPGGDGARFPVRSCDVTTDDVAIPPGTDAVFYLAQSPFYRGFPARADHLFGVNLVGAIRTAAGARAAGAGLFLYASSGTIYAPSFRPMAETCPLRRDDGYVLSKVCAEDALALALEGTDVRLLRARLFGVFGPRQRGMLVQNLAARIRGGQAVTVDPHPRDPDDDDGLQLSMTYVCDLVRWLADLAAMSLGGRVTADPLNMAGDEVASVRWLAGRIGEEIGVAPSFVRGQRARPSDFIADIGRLRDLVAPTFTPLAEAIGRTLAVHV